jgi:hypothetical protein
MDATDDYYGIVCVELLGKVFIVFLMIARTPKAPPNSTPRDWKVIIDLG